METRADQFKKAILKKKKLTAKTPYHDGQLYHIAFSGTSNYLVHTGVTMTSILKSNEDLTFAFHLFINDICEEDVQKMQVLADQFHCTVTLYYVNDEVFQEMLHRDGIAAFFYRFIIPPVLQEEQVERVLYLDGDIMCQNSIQELMDMDLSGHIAACVEDTSPAFAEARRQKIGTHRYFNSGMMLIDVNQWNEQNISQKAAAMAVGRKQSGKPLGTHDQDILNILLDEKIDMIPQKYNYIYNLDMKGLFQEQHPLIYDPEAVFVHFAGIVKPWRIWVQDTPGAQEYNAFRLASPWKDIPLTGFQRYKDIHQAARHARRMGHYGKMLALYGAYVSAKLTGKV